MSRQQSEKHLCVRWCVCGGARAACVCSTIGDVVPPAAHKGTIGQMHEPALSCANQSCAHKARADQDRVVAAQSVRPSLFGKTGEDEEQHLGRQCENHGVAPALRLGAAAEIVIR